MSEKPEIPEFLRRADAPPQHEETGMGRPKGSKNRPKVQPDESAAAAINGNGAEPGHNKKPAAGSLTEAQRQALALAQSARAAASCGEVELFAIQRTEDGEAFDAADALPGGDPDFGEDGEGATAH